MNAPGAQMIDVGQERWLADGLEGSRQRWQLVAQQVMMAPIDRRTTAGAQAIYNMDSWAGYPGQRERIFEQFGRHSGGNVVVVTGDEHQNFALDLVHGGRTVASELVSTSISSGSDGYDERPGNDVLMADNPNLRWTNDRRGYLMCDVTREAWTGRFRVLDAVTRKDMPVRTVASWAIESGKRGLVRA